MKLLEKATTSPQQPVRITPKASEMVKEIMNKKGIPSGYELRIGIKGGAGCLGVNYIIGFDQRKEGDEEYEIQGVKVLIEKKHLMFLLGVTLDYVIDGETVGFSFNR